MQLHIRWDEYNKAHVRLTVFVNGANCGRLCMFPPDAEHLESLLERAVEAGDDGGYRQDELKITHQSFGADREHPAGMSPQLVRRETSDA